MYCNALTLGVMAIAFATQAPAQTPAQSPPAKNSQAVPADRQFDASLFKLSDLTDLDLRSETDKSLGDIDGILVDPKSGKIEYALVGKGGVLGIGETEHIIPWEKIKVTPKEKDKAKEKDKEAKAHTTLTAEQIESAPIYKKDKHIDAETERNARAAAGMSSGESSVSARTVHLVSSKEIDDNKVHGSDDKDLGEIDEVIVAPREGAIAYVVLGSGGVLGMGEKTCALPWGIVQSSFDKDEKLVLKTPIVKDRLVKAPAYDSKDWKRMKSGAWVQELCTYHSCDPYWTATVGASAEKRPQ